MFTRWSIHPLTIHFINVSLITRSILCFAGRCFAVFVNDGGSVSVTMETMLQVVTVVLQARQVEGLGR